MKTVKILLVFVLVAFSYQQADAYICRVPQDSSTIQGCINAVSNGDTVLVARGTYYENIDFLSKNILVVSNYILDGLQATIDSTIIDGRGLGRVVKMQSVNGANTGIVGFTLMNGQVDRGAGIYCYSSSTQISYNVIRGNRASDRGGGIYCTNSSSIRITHNFIAGDTATCLGGGISVEESSPTIDSNQILSNEAVNGGGIKFSDSSSGDIYGNIIRNNRAWSDNGGGNGGGLHIDGGSYPNIHNNIIDSNTVRYFGGGIDCAGGSSPNITENYISANNGPAGGGGISCGSSSPMIERNTIRKNVSRDCGGGILVRNSYATIAYNLIDSNECSSYGGGVLFYADTSSFFNNTVDRNSSSEYNAGGGIHCMASSAPRIWNNIITNSLNGWGISCFPTSNPYISHNDIWHNYDGNFYNCPPGVGDTSWGENCNHTPCDSFYNIIQDPLFDPDSTNYFLLCNSPCIDAGDPSDPVPPGGGRYIDMGAVEYPYICGDANSDGVHNSADVVFKINYLFRNGPAPCPLGSADDNRDCIVNSADIVYELNYLFAGGPPPLCGGKESPLTTPLSKLYHASGFDEISLSEPKFTKGGVGEIIITGKFDLELVAVELEVNYDPEEIRIIEPTLTPRFEGLQIYFGATNGQLKIGILDINGVHRIPAGTGPILTLKAMAEDLSSLKISQAILVDQNANAFLANVAEKLEASSSLPSEYCLYQNYPNPFNPETEISYDLPKDCWVKLSICNIRGQKVKTFVDEFQATGHKTVIWDGKNDQGAEVASGVYFYRLEAGEFTATKKMVILR